MKMDNLHRQLEKYKRGLESEKDWASRLYCSMQIEKIEKQIAAQQKGNSMIPGLFLTGCLLVAALVYLGLVWSWWPLGLYLCLSLVVGVEGYVSATKEQHE